MESMNKDDAKKFISTVLELPEPLLAKGGYVICILVFCNLVSNQNTV